MAWEKVRLDAPVLGNVDETALPGAASATLENAFITETGVLQRFPGLRDFTRVAGGRVTLTDWRDDLIAITSIGQVWRISASGDVTDLTGFQVTGGGRPVSAKTENELVIAAGGPIVRLRGNKTERLSSGAPNSTHVAFISGYLAAIEPGSGRFWHSRAGAYDQWDPLDVFSAEGNPDNLTAAVVTPFNELLLAGPQSIEQFEPVASGTQPFFRRYAMGDGVRAPYTLVVVDGALCGINTRYEWARYSGQISQDIGQLQGRLLERVDDWREAWADLIHIEGQKFVVLQAPKATNRHGTAGVTLLFDYRAGRWASLSGWDADVSQPGCWPGRSVCRLWGRWFVGGEGGRIYALEPDAFDTAGAPQPVLWRSGHWQMEGHRTRVGNSRITVRRGGTDVNAAEPVLRIRVNRDNRGWSGWKAVGLGKAGHRQMTVGLGAWGAADTWQWELSMTDAAACQIMSLEVETHKS